MEERKKEKEGRRDGGLKEEKKERENGEERETTPVGLTATIAVVVPSGGRSEREEESTDEGERRGGSSLLPPWRPAARVITASFVGSLPPNPFLPPPLESRTGEGEDAGQCREEECDPLHNAAPPCVVAVAELPWLPLARFKGREARGERKIGGGGFCSSGRASTAFHRCRSATVHRAAPRHVAAGNCY
ncbi:uncharacterized protein [Arachis hypogaea]|uniref:uncharacterized protein n=1 Tax=Arachis hypogaea TaxID=3818 RepID=UPI003B226F31|nr:uncharacterized protein DS421_4g127520 [Arachis hypogaea]